MTNHPYIHIPDHKILGFTRDCSKHGSLESRLFLADGRLYPTHIQALAQHEHDVRVTLLHPRSHEPIVAAGGRPLENVTVAKIREAAVEYADSHAGFLPIGGTDQPDDMQPMYCEEALPLILRYEGRGFFTVSFRGGTSYTIYRPGQPPLGPLSGPSGHPPSP